MNKITTRAAAKAAGLKRYLTGKACLHGHVGERLVSTCACVECNLESNRKQYAKNPEARRERWRKFYGENREVLLERSRKWYEENREASQERSHKYHAENREVLLERSRKWARENRELIRERGRKWGRENRDKVRAKCALRRARKREAIPSWFDEPVHKKLMAEHYENKFVIAALLGVDPSELHEDHIIPLGLRDDDGNMIGWHSADNLEWMIAAQNLSKSNKYPYTYPTGTFNLVTRLSQRPTD